MTFDQLKAFVAAPDHVRQIALTKAAARQLIAEHEREVGHQDRGFEIPVRHSAGVSALERAAIDRSNEEAERTGWSGVFAEVDAQRKAGLRESVS